ncbi:SCO2583 family membrane protein [Streptomyces sp. NPDC002851]
MAGTGDPPEGTPEGVPGGGDEEYRSVVFDESFVSAAPLQESSAQERITDHAPAVRRRPGRPGQAAGKLSRQALILILLIAVAFGTAIYMGVRHPYQQPTGRPADPLRTTVIPLVPQGPVPGADKPDDLFARSPAAEFKSGAAGITLPGARRTAHFSDSQVMSALTTVKDYLVASSLDPKVLTGETVRPVRMLVDPDQHAQFDQSVDQPAADGRHATPGWLIRFDPAKTELADTQVRVSGVLNVTETERDVLEVTSDHTFAYALRPAGDDDGPASLFTVRRELHFRFDTENVRLHQAQLVTSYVQAGPLACGTDSAARLHPLLAGQTAKDGAPAGTNPYATDNPAALCGSLAPSAQPSGDGPGA